MNYKVIRSARRTVSISVSSDNQVIVRCPLKTTEKKIKKFVASKADWLNKIINENENKINKNKSVIAYKEIYVGGVKLPIVISKKNAIEADAVYLKSLSDIKSTFIKYFSEDFIKRARKIADGLNLKVSGFYIKGYKSRWGCCDRNGKITFNYLLFMLPPQVQNYVIIHELCHIVYFNHSPSFWRLVASFLPEYKILRNQLKSFDFIIKLY